MIVTKFCSELGPQRPTNNPAHFEHKMSNPESPTKFVRTDHPTLYLRIDGLRDHLIRTERRRCACFGALLGRHITLRGICAPARGFPSADQVPVLGVAAWMGAWQLRRSSRVWSARAGRSWPGCAADLRADRGSGSAASLGRQRQSRRSTRWQRVRRAGEVFTMTLTRDGAIRENHVTEFDEGRRIAWRPAEVGQRPPGHLWRWELQPALRSTHPGHLHLRLDGTDRPHALPASPGDHGRQAPGVARPACGSRRGTLTPE